MRSKIVGYSEVVFITVLLVISGGCNLLLNGGDDNNDNDEPVITAVVFQDAVQSGGVSGSADSTGLTLSFDANPTTLSADHITVTGATKGALSGSGTTRSLVISDITVANGETISIAISSPPGYSVSGSPQTATVFRVPIAVTFQSAVQSGGASGSADSTGLTLSFDANPTTLNADHITVTGATKGELSGSGTTRSLVISDITVANGETISIAISSPPGYSVIGSPQTATVFRQPYIGMPYQGGIIAYIPQQGDPGYGHPTIRGIIAATSDLGSAPWITGLGTTTHESGANATAVYYGHMNIPLIKAVPGYTGGAAKVADDYVNPDEGTGVYSDWHLPSKDEMLQLYNNRVAIGITGSDFYWTSSEAGSDWAYFVQFHNGSATSYGKTNSATILPVRYF